MNDSINYITEQQIATSHQITSGPYSPDQMWANLFERLSGNIPAAHAHLNAAQKHVNNLFAEAYEAKRDHLNAAHDEAIEAATDLQARIDQMRHYLRAVACAQIMGLMNLPEANGSIITISPDNWDYRNVSQFQAQTEKGGSN